MQDPDHICIIAAHRFPTHAFDYKGGFTQHFFAAESASVDLDNFFLLFFCTLSHVDPALVDPIITPVIPLV